MNRKTMRKLVDEIKDVYDNPYARIHRDLKKRRISHVPYSRRYPKYFSIRRKNIILDELEGVSTFNPCNKGT